MCTYNGMKFLREQLDSIISQTYPIYEIIIQDDCSTDGTVAIIKEYVDKYSHIHLYINEDNLGFNNNFKSATMKASGDYVAFSDQDDVWFPEKIEKQVTAICDYDICCSYFMHGEKLTTARFCTKKINFERALFSSILGHTMLCRRDFVQNEKYWLSPIWYDWSLTIHAYLSKGVTIVKEPLSWHRKHSDEVTWTNIQYQHTSYHPYLFGLKKLREKQKEENWVYVYSYIYNQTSKKEHPIVNKLCFLLLQTSFPSLLSLCFQCFKYRELIYPSDNTHGIMGAIRSFFYPMIYAYPLTTLYHKCS